MKIKIKKLKAEMKMLRYHHPGDVGMDLFALEDAVIPPGGHQRFDHGFALEFPIGFAGIIKDKGSLAKEGLHTLGGVFDAGFRGEYNTNLVNLSDQAYTVEKGDKVSQLVIYPVEIVELEETEELSESARGMGKWGSTGKK